MSDHVACDHPQCECSYDCERNDKHDEWVKENPYKCFACGEVIDPIRQDSAVEVMTGRRFHEVCRYPR